METFPCKVIMKLLIYQNSKSGLKGSYAFLCFYKQSFSGEGPKLRSLLLGKISVSYCIYLHIISERDAFDTLFDHAPDKLNLVKKVS